MTGGVAIITHKSLQVQVCPIRITNSHIDIVKIKLLNCSFLEYVVSIYCPSNIHTTQTDWDEIFALCPKKSLIAGDFNAHHSNWSYKIDTRGTQLSDSALDNNFIYLNNGQFTRIKLVYGNMQKSSPDVTFASSDIAINFEWQISQENLGSDHLVIKLHMNYSKNLQLIKRRNYSKTDWASYRKYLNETFTSTGTIERNAIQSKYDHFQEQLLNAADQSIPFTKINPNPENNFKPKPYWTPALSHVVAQRRLYLKNFRRNPTPENLKKLNDKINEAKRLISQAKAQSWQKFCNSIDESTTARETWQKMRWAKGLRRTFFNAPDEKRNELLLSLTPDSVSNSTPIFNSSNELLESDFTIQEMKHALKKKDTAPGEDEISHSMLYNLPENGQIYLLNLYNAIFKFNYVPIQWRNVLIIPIPKTGSDPNSIPKLRPISLMSCLCKTFHSMLARRLEWFVEKRNIIPNYSTGFRRSQSCLDCLVRLISYIKGNFTKKTPTVACFLDIENAYNNVSVLQATTFLNELQVGKKICDYLWSYLNERHLKIKNQKGDNVMVRWTDKGLAQGDPISPPILTLLPRN